MLHGATKKDVTSLTQEWLWSLLGAQAKASWLVGWHGIGFCTLGFNATTRDYARLGHLPALGGARDGVQIAPKEYLLDATDNARHAKGFQINEAGDGFGYGYQFWLGSAGGGGFTMVAFTVKLCGSNPKAALPWYKRLSGSSPAPRITC